MDSIILILSKVLFITFMAAMTACLACIGINAAWRFTRNAYGWACFRECVQYFKKNNPARWEEIRRNLTRDEED